MFSRSIYTCLLAAAFLSAPAFSDGFFAVRPGLPALTGTQIGVGSAYSYFVGGMDYALVKYSYDYESKSKRDYGYRDTTIIHTEEMEISVNVFMPSLGFKQYFLRDPIAPYVQLNAFLTIPKVNYIRLFV